MTSLARRGTAHLRRNTVACVALVTAMSGTSYAAAQLPHDSG